MVPSAKLKFEPSIAGLRGVLALLVLCFHTGVPILPGGARGVDMFFVLSGFLITGMLKTELEIKGSIDFVRFWVARLRRLMPALLLFVVIYTILSPTFFPDDVAAWRWRDVLATLTYSYNWDLIARPRLTGLGHMWSLAVEGQFYLLWPLALAPLHRLGRRTVPTLALLFLALTAVRVVGVLLVPDRATVIYSLPGHASGLVLGAMLAYCSSRPAWLGYAGLVGMAAFILLPDRHDQVWGQLWTISVAELSAAALICGLTAPTMIARAFAIRPLLWLGAISYEIYIWHFPFQRFSCDADWKVSTILTLAFAVPCAWASSRLLARRGTSAPSPGKNIALTA